MGKEIFVTKAYLPPRAEFNEYLDRIWDSAWLTNMGRLHEQLKAKLAGYLGVDEIELFVNGHLALEMCLQAFDFPKGGEVITTPFSFASTTHAIVRQGLKPVFADVRPLDCTLDPAKIEALITDKTVAILPVHVYGNICDVDAIQEIAGRHGLKVIYDAAHAFGETVNGRGVGTFGDASMFSFHATKVYNTIEGGAVTWNDDKETVGAGSMVNGIAGTAGAANDGSGVKLCFTEKSRFAGKLYQLKNFGITDQEQVGLVGGNAKMNEFQAAMGLCNLKHIEELIAARRRVYDRYMTGLGLTGVQCENGVVRGNAAANGNGAVRGNAAANGNGAVRENAAANGNGAVRCLLNCTAEGDAGRAGAIQDADLSDMTQGCGILDMGLSNMTTDGRMPDTGSSSMTQGCGTAGTQMKIKRNFAYLPVLFETPQRRDEVFEKLAAKGIHARKYFYPCINDYECYRNEYDSADTPVAKDLAARVLTLPIYHDLEFDIVDEICRTINE